MDSICLTGCRNITVMKLKFSLPIKFWHGALCVTTCDRAEQFYSMKLWNSDKHLASFNQGQAFRGGSFSPKMKTNKTTQIFFATILAIAGFAASVAWAADTEIIPATVSSGNNPCAGHYNAYAKMTNDVGSIWITPPTNIVVSSGTLTDASGFSAPYSSYATVLKKGTTSYLCGSNNVTFPATNTASYQLMVVVTSSPPPPTNGEPMTLQIDWH